MLSLISNNVAKVSAAGSGKTYGICKEALAIASTGDRVLITTYTNLGVEAIRKEIKAQNDGVVNPRVVVKSWFSFILSDMIKPYQNCLTHVVNGIRGYDYSQAYGHINYFSADKNEKYITNANMVRSNEASRLVCKLNKDSGGKVIQRLEEIYKAIFFDEIQDMAGYDIEIIRMLIESAVYIVCCGDNKQATYATHNAKKNKQKTGKNVWSFFSELEKQGLVDIERNLVSRRFNSQICSFANNVFPIGESITTIMHEVTVHDGVFLIGKDDVDVYYNTFKPKVLRYDIKTKTGNYPAVNFGACKGETFERVMIFPNNPMEKFVVKKQPLKSPEKYYVAVTRGKYSIAIVMEKLPRTLDGYQSIMINCEGNIIKALKYITDK